MTEKQAVRLFVVLWLAFAITARAATDVLRFAQLDHRIARMLYFAVCGCLTGVCVFLYRRDRRNAGSEIAKPANKPSVVGLLCAHLLFWFLMVCLWLAIWVRRDGSLWKGLGAAFVNLTLLSSCLRIMHAGWQARVTAKAEQLLIVKD